MSAFGHCQHAVLGGLVVWARTPTKFLFIFSHVLACPGTLGYVLILLVPFVWWQVSLKFTRVLHVVWVWILSSTLLTAVLWSTLSSIEVWRKAWMAAESYPGGKCWPRQTVHWQKYFGASCFAQQNGRKTRKRREDYSLKVVNTEFKQTPVATWDAAVAPWIDCPAPSSMVINIY